MGCTNLRYTLIKGVSCALWTSKMLKIDLETVKNGRKIEEMGGGGFPPHPPHSLAFLAIYSSNLLTLTAL